LPGLGGKERSMDLNQLIHFYTLKEGSNGETMAKHKQNYGFPADNPD